MYRSSSVSRYLVLCCSGSRLVLNEIRMKLLGRKKLNLRCRLDRCVVRASVATCLGEKTLTKERMEINLKFAARARVERLTQKLVD